MPRMNRFAAAMTMKQVLATLVLALLAMVSTSQGADETAGFAKAVEPFFAKYCFRCHDAKKQEGEFRLDTLQRHFEDMAVAQRWGEVLFRVNSGEMPPKDEQQPEALELGALSEWISARINEGRAARMAKRGPVAHYRLSRDEYANTVYDLLGVHFDVRMPGALNEDPRWHGFDRIGSMLSLSPSHVNRYFAAAERVLPLAFPVHEPQSPFRRQEAPNGRWLLFPSQRQGNFNAPIPGRYRIRVQLSALSSFKGRMPRLSVWNNSLKRSIVGQDVVAAEAKPAIVEIETFLSKGGFSLVNEAPGMLSDGHTLAHTPKNITSTQSIRSLRPTGYKLFDEDGKPIFPLLLVDWIEWEGPLLTEADRKKSDGLYPSKEGDLADVRTCLKRFIERAWRRPASQEEVYRYFRLV